MVEEEKEEAVEAKEEEVQEVEMEVKVGREFKEEELAKKEVYWEEY